MYKEHMNIVIVGHVDHGKSTLIGRLLYDTGSLPETKFKELEEASKALGREIEFGFVLDHLQEEREQGVTIDTTQKVFSTEKRNYTIIDAPGHVEFIKNMITGASLAEAGILIVDAEEGVQEQTRRHAYILSMLGLNQIIAVINKMDKVNYSKERFEKVKKELIEFLKKINIKPDYFIPASAKKGNNIAKKSDNLYWYKGETFLKALDSFKIENKEIKKELRMPIQDVYNFNERIAVGRVVSGKIKTGQKIIILPTNEKTRIGMIKTFDKELKEAIAGQNIGLITKDKVFLERGYLILGEGEKLPEITNEIKAHVFWLDKIPYKKGERLLFRCSTQESKCELKIKEKTDSSSLKKIKDALDKIENREVAEVIIKTEKPVAVEDFNKMSELGRFVFEREDTVAGGIITK